MRDGFVRKPFRLISKGIGEGYLKKDFFNVFKDKELTQWKAIHCPSLKSYENTVEKLEKEGDLVALDEYKEYYRLRRKEVDEVLAKKEKDVSEYLDLTGIKEEQFDKLRVYYDEAGFPHKLPMYYRNKLLRGSNNEKNVYQFEVQNVLEQGALLRDNQIIQQEAALLGIRIPDD